MSAPVALFSTAAIAAGPFSTVVSDLGGSLDPMSASRARVSRGQRHVWLYLQSKDLMPPPEGILAAVQAALGGKPATNIVLEISRHPGSEEVAFEIARAFAERWPVVLHDLQVPGKVFSQRELLKSRVTVPAP